MRTEAAQEFTAAYRAVLARWPAGTTTGTVDTPYGSTHVTSCGPEGAPPLLLFPGGGASAMDWLGCAPALARTHRVHAPDLVGEPGLSLPAANRPVRSVTDLATWWEAVRTGLGIGPEEPVDLAGHSYGAWIALSCALRAPGRVRRLALLDPTGCFGRFRARYLLRALPVLLAPSPARTRRFRAWESGGAAADPDWLRLQERAADFPTVRPVTGPRPDRAALAALRVPVLALFAERSGCHDARRTAAAATAALPHARVRLLPGATHHGLPFTAPTPTTTHLTDFFTA
ncbi:alpha/beta fold hydrolase [Streptomyces sp. NPDC097619]|uniref:alpha/beta fold hydrolase n=1 Tax=Streptomyces sp. NPDC097619 TaxID=3157228 RepID=UPI00331DCF21